MLVCSRIPLNLTDLSAQRAHLRQELRWLTEHRTQGEDETRHQRKGATRFQEAWFAESVRRPDSKRTQGRREHPRARPRRRRAPLRRRKALSEQPIATCEEETPRFDTWAWPAYSTRDSSPPLPAQRRSTGFSLHSSRKAALLGRLAG